MGVVYEAFDPRLNRRVAIKTIVKSNLADATADDYSARFEREAQAVGRLSHPNIVQVHDFGEERGVAYLVLEFIKGNELKARFDTGHRFTLADTVRIMGEVCDALEFAHAAGIVHRDVKPANIMLDAQMRAKLTDFGVARIQDMSSSHMTQTGAMIGTPAYMSPEQISGTAIDRRSDIFSAGIVLYQFLTGEMPFGSGGAWTVAKRIMQDQPPMPSSRNRALPPHFDAVVNKALAKDPASRYQTAAEFAQALKDALDGGAAAVDPEATIALPSFAANEVVLPEEHRETPWVPIIAGIAVSVLGGAIWYTSAPSGKPAPAPAPAASAPPPAVVAPPAEEKAGTEKPDAEQAAADKLRAEKAAQERARALEIEAKDKAERELARLEKVRQAAAAAKKAAGAKPAAPKAGTEPRRDARPLDEVMRAANALFNSRAYADAAAEYRIAADGNDAFAQFRLGYLYSAGYGVTTDYAEAMRWYRKAAEQNQLAAINNIGWLYQQGLGVPKDHEEALRWYRRAADGNHAESQNNVGIVHYNGWAVPKDYEQAARWYRKAAEQGHPHARANLGSLYVNGFGVAQDYAEAMRWYKLAAEQNHASAQTSLGAMYHNGLGVAKDYGEALRWYRRAADQNFAAAQNNLGLLHYYGLGVAKDDAEAWRWFKRAADQNHPGANYWMGFLWENGRGGVAPDAEEAKSWYRRAARLGNAQAKGALQRLGE